MTVRVMMVVGTLVGEGGGDTGMLKVVRAAAEMAVNGGNGSVRWWCGENGDGRAVMTAVDTVTVVDGDGGRWGQWLPMESFQTLVFMIP